MRYFLQPQFTEGSETPYGNNPEAGHYVTSGDAKIYYEVYGLGDDVVILNEGGTGCSYELGSMIDEIREYYRVIVVSSRGQGKSEMGHMPFSLSQKAADVLAVIHEEAEDPVMIVGVGDGAYAAMEAAIEEPEIVDRIVAIGAGTLKKGFIPATIPYSDVVNADPDFIEQQKKLMPESERAEEIFNTQISYLHSLEIDEDFLSQIECPVLLVCGDGDTHCPMVTAFAASQWIPHSCLCIVPRSWHTVYMYNFPLIRAAMLPFMGTSKAGLVTTRKIAYNIEALQRGMYEVQGEEQIPFGKPILY